MAGTVRSKQEPRTDTVTPPVTHVNVTSTVNWRGRASAGIRGTHMADLRRELEKRGLRHVGWMRAGCCPGERCRIQHQPKHYHAQIAQDIESNVVYAVLINGEVMKFGKAGSKAGSLRSRMDDTISAGNQAWLFAEGRPISDAGWMHRKLDKFKQVITDVIRTAQEIEIYAGEFAADTFEAKERELNGLYRPPWPTAADVAGTLRPCHYPAWPSTRFPIC